jgi:phage-related protein
MALAGVFPVRPTINSTIRKVPIFEKAVVMKLSELFLAFLSTDKLSQFGYMTTPLKHVSSDKAGQGLFEIRTKGKEDIFRSVFCAVKGKEIVILITVIKKANKIPKRQMDTAMKRMKEVLSDD